MAAPGLQSRLLVQRAKADPRSLTTSDVALLQQLVGNRAVTSLLATPAALAPTSKTTRGSAPVQRIPIKGTWRQLVPAPKKGAYATLIGTSTDTTQLSEDRLKQLLAFMKELNVLALADAVNALQKQVDDLTPEPAKPRKELTEVERQALARLGRGTTWKELAPQIGAWWDDLKLRERGDTWEAAFKDNRMTARQVSTGGRGGDFNVPRTVLGGERKMKLGRNVPGTLDRMKPDNFYAKDGRRRKNALGLHDLSASLLDGSKPSIYNQLKHYEKTVTLFMPVPPEADLQVLSALAKLEDRDEKKIREMKSQITRIKLAQSSDMGTSFVDISTKESAPGKFRYGTIGTIIRERQATGKTEGELATQEELAARKTNAIEYKKILKDGLNVVTEVVMAYRQCEAALFPMFGSWDGSGFKVVDAKGIATGHYITDAGVYS